MASEQILAQILLKHSGLSRDEIARKLEEEKLKTGGFLSDETLLRMIALELGVEFQNDETALSALSVTDLVPSLNNVTIAGRIVAIFPPKTFTGKKNGKFASFLIADKTGILRVVLWNDKTSLLESDEMKVGQIIRIHRGYSKEGRWGIELHASEKSRFEITPKDVEPTDYPTISKYVTKIGKIDSSQANRKANLEGKVKRISSASTFERKDASQGKVIRFALTDETGEITVVAWNEKADEVETLLKAGDRLLIVDARIRRAMNEGLEAHVDSATYVELQPAKEEPLRISDLREGLHKADVEGRVATRPMYREVRTNNEERVKLASFELMDETGKIWVSTWRKHAETAKELKIGDRVIIRDVYVRKGFDDQLEASTRETSSINIIH